MNTLDTLYKQFLTLGFVMLKYAQEADDINWIGAEIELLHNIPSLIGETNKTRHAYFWQKERTAYLNWVISLNREQQRSRMATFYEPLWDEMEPLIAALE